MPIFRRNRLSGARPNRHVANSLTRFDQFGRKLPGFALRGEESVNTASGGFFTLILFLIIASFGFDKAIKVVNRMNPVVNKITQTNAIDESEVINIGASNFRFAFSLEKGYA